MAWSQIVCATNKRPKGGIHAEPNSAQTNKAGQYIGAKPRAHLLMMLEILHANPRNS